MEKHLEIFLNDGILCKYDVNNESYGHFPSWFDKKFCLKQVLNHPKDDEFPVCEYHPNDEKNTGNKREISHTIETKLNQINKKEVNTNNRSVSSFAPTEVGQQETELEGDDFNIFITNLAKNLKSPTKV